MKGSWTHAVAVEGVEDPRDVAAEDADRETRVVQCHPAAAGFLWAMAAEQVIANRAQHGHLSTTAQQRPLQSHNPYINAVIGSLKPHWSWIRDQHFDHFGDLGRTDPQLSTPFIPKSFVLSKEFSCTAKLQSSILVR